MVGRVWVVMIAECGMGKLESGGPRPHGLSELTLAGTYAYVPTSVGLFGVVRRRVGWYNEHPTKVITSNGGPTFLV